MDFSDRFLVLLDPFKLNTVRMPPEAPCCRLGDGLGQSAEQLGVIRNDVEGEVVDDDRKEVIWRLM